VNSAGVRPAQAGLQSDADTPESDTSLQRHARHLLLEGWGFEAHARLTRSHALVIGVGGLGASASMFLAASGVGQLTLIDPDEVDLTNLQRQIVHRTDAIGQPKVHSAAATLSALNPEVKIRALARIAEGELLADCVREADVVLDCTDHFATRQAVNAACLQWGRPLVSAAALGWDGQISVFTPGGPCYACLFPPDAPPQEARCATMGVFAPLVGIMGSTQAAEALKLLAGLPSSLRGRLLMLDARRMEWTTLAMGARPGCGVCGRAPPTAQPGE
jgi:molybdopterin/thiamine biosynthesis adenylyltransferase